jgi:hypothetical protein
MSNDEQLAVTSVHLYPLENAKLHHTDRFEVLHRDNPTVILRRGQSFHLAICFSGRTYDSDKDVVQLVFTYGNFNALTAEFHLQYVIILFFSHKRKHCANIYIR